MSFQHTKSVVKTAFLFFFDRFYIPFSVRNICALPQIIFLSMANGQNKRYSIL